MLELRDAANQRKKDRPNYKTQMDSIRTKLFSQLILFWTFLLVVPYI